LYDVKLSVYKHNLSRGFDTEYITEIPVRDIEVSNISAGESRVYTITAELFEPEKSDIYRLIFGITWPDQITDNNNNQIKIEDVFTEFKPNIPQNDVIIYLYGEDARISNLTKLKKYKDPTGAVVI
ncbi:MAG: hypothetical protein J6104_01065, partial [Methanomicrobium sp.]|nr:hypothetical protein [Methanomicrobium sp.]